jgi:hypothetical protein
MFVYSQDEYLLDSPFPVLAGISKKLLGKILEKKKNLGDVFVFDFSKKEWHFEEDELGKVEFVPDGELLGKAKEKHKAIFNSEESHVLELDGVKVRKKKGGDEVIGDDLEEPSLDELKNFFEIFQNFFDEFFLKILDDVRVIEMINCCFRMS